MTLGCRSWTPYENVVFKDSPPSTMGKRIPIVVGIDLFEDLRTNEEKSKMASLSNVDREVTVKFAKYLEHCQVFSDVKLPCKPSEVDVILKGKIKNFKWTASNWMPCYLKPLIMSPCILCCLPLGRITTRIDLEISLENPHTGKIIASYFETQDTSKRFNFYNARNAMKSRGDEINDLMQDVTAKIIERIFADRFKILEALGS